MENTPISMFWFRRDLRLDDNAGLYYALRSGYPVLPVFIFDTEILHRLTNRQDARVQFIHREVDRLKTELRQLGSDLLVKIGSPLQVWAEIIREYPVKAVFANHDYESYGNHRDFKLLEILREQSIGFRTYKDIVIFEKDEIVKEDGLPYTVFTPYSRKWRAGLTPFYHQSYPTSAYFSALLQVNALPFPSLTETGFQQVVCCYPENKVNDTIVRNYSRQRDYPSVDGTSHLGIHLRFGTLSIRKLLTFALSRNQTFVNELIWRDFYQQIVWHFNYVEQRPFKQEYERIRWENNEDHFQQWCTGNTGIPIVDAGMRQLNETGYLHNRVRMIVASFLTKNLLIDWRWGEAYFASKLLDFDLAANNGGWQWAAGCGTDAAPYFRIFNPLTQAKKFDPDGTYIKKWVPEVGTPDYPPPMIDLKASRERCLNAYREALRAS